MQVSYHVDLYEGEIPVFLNMFEYEEESDKGLVYSMRQ